jgi:phospholipid/cholesterol/gamma-HCH transport system substrate-binding protein
MAAGPGHDRPSQWVRERTMRASNLMIGGATLALIAAVVAGLLTVQKLRTTQSRSPIRIVFDGGSAAGLRRGGPVDFDGIQAGQIVSIKLKSPQKIVVLAMLDNSAPIRKDTVVGIEFQGLTGIAAVSLVGGAPTAPPVPLDQDGIPVLNADLHDQESMTESLHNVDHAIAENETAIRDGLSSFESYTASLKSKGDAIDAVMDKADSAFAGFDSVIAKIEGVVPGFADGKADELFEKLRALREMADSFRLKSAKLMEESRQTLHDISDAANKMEFKLDPRAQAANDRLAAPPRKPPQQVQPKRP